MKKIALLFTAFAGMAFSGQAQITGPTTVSVGSPATWTLQNAPIVNSYTWVPEGSSQPSSGLTATSVSGGKLGANAAMPVADYPTIWNDNGHWFAFTITRGVTPSGNNATLYRLDLGTDPTPSNTNAANAVTAFDLVALGLPANTNHFGGTNSAGEIVHTMVYDPGTKEWHLFWTRKGYNTDVNKPNDVLRISRLDFGTSLGNTPTTATLLNVPTVADYQNNGLMANAQVAQSKFVRTADGDFIMFIGNRWPDGILRVNFGKNIKNISPKFDRLPNIVTAGTGIGAQVGRSSALEVVQQDGKWYLFCSTTDANGTNGNELWRFDFGSDLTSTPSAVTGLGSLPGYNHWGLQIVPSACGSEYYGFICGRGEIYRLDFKGSLTNVPTTQQIGTSNNNGLPGSGDNSGFFAYPYRDTLYAIMGGASNNGLYSMRLPYRFNGGMPTHKQPGDSTFTHTYTTPGTYELTAIVNLMGGGSAIYCHQVTVTAAPAQPGAFTAAKPSVCVGESNVTYTVPAVVGATSYEWVYSGTGGVLIANATTSAPTNTLSFTGAGSGTLRVRAVNGSGNGSYRDTAITINALPTVTVAPSGSQSICAGDSLQLTATASGVSYEWKMGTTTVGNSATYKAAVAGSYTVRVTSATTGCSAELATPVTITVNPLPTASVSAGGQTDICIGDTVLLSAAQGSGYIYQWKNGTINVGLNNNTYGAYESGNYKVVVQDANNCTDSSQEVSVTVHTLPVVTLTPGDTAFCEGGLVTLEVNSQDTGLTYIWKNGSAVVPLATAYFLEIDETGVYTVAVGRAGIARCETVTNAVTVTVHPLPTVDVQWDGNTLHATPGYASYQWFSATQPLVGATDSTFRPSAPGVYSVKAVDNNGCENTSSGYNVTSIDNSNVGYVDPAVQPVLYPNPANGTVYISGTADVQVRVFDATGRLVLRSGPAVRMLDISALTPGVYLAVITGENGLQHTERLHISK
jgi:hypothetical protein